VRRGRPGPLRPHHPAAVGQVSLGVLLPVLGIAPREYPLRGAVPRHRPDGLPVLSQVQPQKRVPAPVRQAAQALGGHLQEQQPDHWCLDQQGGDAAAMFGHQAIPARLCHSDGAVAGGLQGNRGYPRSDGPVQEDARAQDHGKLLPEVGHGLQQGGKPALPRCSPAEALSANARAEEEPDQGRFAAHGCPCPPGYPFYSAALGPSRVRQVHRGGQEPPGKGTETGRAPGSSPAAHPSFAYSRSGMYRIS